MSVIQRRCKMSAWHNQPTPFGSAELAESNEDLGHRVATEVGETIPAQLSSRPASLLVTMTYPLDSTNWWTLQIGGLYKLVDSTNWWTLQIGGLYKLVDSTNWWTLQIGGLYKLGRLRYSSKRQSHNGFAV